MIKAIYDIQRMEEMNWKQRSIVALISANKTVNIDRVSFTKNLILSSVKVHFFLFVFPHLVTSILH